MISSAVRDTDALRFALRRLDDDLGAEVLFGGLIDDRGEVTLSQTRGTRTGRLVGLAIRPRSGLGGRVLAEARPRMVSDYRTASDITHEYDREVLGERIASLVAVPVAVSGRVRGLIYVGSRAVDRLGRPTEVATAPVAERLAREISIRDEVDRRMAHLDPVADARDVRETTTLREVWAEVRSIADRTDDPVASARLRELEARLAPEPAAERRLSRRELDVLALAALGCGNAEIAERLGVGIETVRSYLRNAMRKLDVHSRLEAVTAARRLGELL